MLFRRDLLADVLERLMAGVAPAEPIGYYLSVVLAACMPGPESPIGGGVPAG